MDAIKKLRTGTSALTHVEVARILAELSARVEALEVKPKAKRKPRKKAKK